MVSNGLRFKGNDEPFVVLAGILQYRLELNLMRPDTVSPEELNLHENPVM